MKSIFSSATLRLLGFAVLFIATSCDFGNKTKDIDENGNTNKNTEGTIQEGDNVDDESQPADTAEIGSFQ
jgi:hypothetical protein